MTIFYCFMMVNAQQVIWEIKEGVCIVDNGVCSLLIDFKVTSSNQISDPGCLFDGGCASLQTLYTCFKRRGYNKVKSNRDKAHREGALSSFYHLVKMIFICTFSTFTVLCVCAGRHLKAGGRSKRSSTFLSSGDRTQWFQEEGVVSEFKGVQNF